MKVLGCACAITFVTLMDWTCVCARLVAGKAVLVFSTAASSKFQELVAPYMAPSMAYKLLPRFRGLGTVVPEYVEPGQRLVPARVLDVHASSLIRGR